MPIFFTLLLSLVLLQTPVAYANDAHHKTAETSNATIEITTAYAFATMPGGVTGAVFMTFKNSNDADDKLIDVKSDIAKFTEIHENFIDPDDGMMMMRKIKNAALPVNQDVKFHPKGKHVMLIKLKEPLTLDSTFPITLVFEHAEEKTIHVKVVQPGSTPSMAHHGHGSH